MAIQGWFEADPFWVHVSAEGILRVLLGDAEVYRQRFQLSTDRDDVPATDHGLLVLPGNERLPPFSPRSWINRRGMGQIVSPGQPFVFCRLNGRMRLPPNQVAEPGASMPSGRHPKAAFWLALAADLASAEVELNTLQLLTGYSYPSTRAWARAETTRGHLEISQSGRTQRFTVTKKGREAWWQEIQAWWPTWRQARWPKLHGPAAVSWARWTRRLPEYAVGPSPGHGLDSRPDTWIWATGADHLTLTGRLIQVYDSDVWMSASAWMAWKDQATLLTPPSDARAWPGTRVSVFADDDPLARLLCARAGIVHPSWQHAGPQLATRQGPPLLDGLPLLDALAASDARVIEQGRAALSTMNEKAKA